jgi:site-specific recombinase XerD
MIFGRGTEKTDEAIIEEYHRYLRESNHLHNAQVVAEAYSIPFAMCKFIGKPIIDWKNEDILALYRQRKRASHTRYHVFLTFLLFRGYHHADLPFLEIMHIDFSRCWAPLHAPYRKKIVQAEKALGRKAALTEESPATGTLLELLICVLIVTHQTLDELTREAFDTFREAYQKRYRKTRKDGLPDSRLFRLEQYLVHWNNFSPTRTAPRHETLAEQIRHETFQAALLHYIRWCNVKYEVSTSYTRRAALLTFFLWLQQRFPDVNRLDGISREIVLSFMEHLKQQIELGRYAKSYAHSFHSSARQFFDFVIDEQLPTSPGRNPFSVRDMPRKADMVPRYLSDQELRTLLTYCEQEATVFERTVIITLLHTGIRIKELISLKVSDIVQIGGVWKLHIHQGKGLKDRLIPLTPRCLEVLQEWQKLGWEPPCDSLFTYFGRPRKSTYGVAELCRTLGRKLGIEKLTAHRFRHSFAVALLNYGIRESALQKLMGHATLNMTLEYARILDQTVEQSFTSAIEQLQEGAHSWVPNFFVQEDYTLFVEGDAVSWIRLPLGYCRRNVKLHCESDVKCLLCDRFAIGKEDLPRLQQMYERFTKLGLTMKADVVAAQIQRLELPSGEVSGGFIPATAVSVARRCQ